MHLSYNNNAAVLALLCVLFWLGVESVFFYYLVMYLINLTTPFFFLVIVMTTRLHIVDASFCAFSASSVAVFEVVFC